MISYAPFWKTLAASHENWYTLTEKHHVSKNTLSRMKNQTGGISTTTINDLCKILNCRVEDIIEYIPDE